MKYLLIPAMTLLLACGGESSSTTDHDSTEANAPIYEVTQTELYSCNLGASEVTWDRVLDQKPRKVKKKFLGADIEVELGAVKLDMHGDVSLIDGSLSVVNETLESAEITFDMATFQFAENKGEGLFNTTAYPNSTLRFLSFEDYPGDNYNYMAKMELTIQDHTETIEAPLMIMDNKMGDEYQIDGDLKFNTLDFPLRKDADAAAVNLDEITVHLKLNFGRTETNIDSVIVD